jgi:hypothetical protein
MQGGKVRYADCTLAAKSPLLAAASPNWGNCLIVFATTASLHSHRRCSLFSLMSDIIELR